MLEELVSRDLVAAHLYKKSGLPYAQADTYYIDQVVAPTAPLRERIGLRSIKILTKGSYARSSKQAEIKIIKSLYTILFSLYIGALQQENLQRLLELLQLLRNTSPPLTPANLQQPLEMLDLIVQRLAKTATPHPTK